MQRLFLLAPLGTMLLLASCDQRAGDGEIAGGRGSEGGASIGSMLPRNSSNPERIAAEDSLGKAPPPINLVAGRSDKCPVHHERMSVHEVPVVFEETRPAGGESVRAPGAGAFPFAEQEFVTTGSSLLPGESRTALVFQCAKCVAGKRVAAAELKRAAAPKASE